MADHLRQKLASPSLGLSFLIHIVGLSSFAASFKYLVDNPTPINDSYGWHFQYLTIIGLSLASATFFLGAVADITYSANIFWLKNILLISTAPLEVLVSILYWGISAIDKRLVVPEWAVLSRSAGEIYVTQTPNALPQFLLAKYSFFFFIDFGFHLVPSILLTLDFFLFSPPWTISVAGATTLSSVIAFSYWFWVEQCYRYNGLYPYPLFESLTVPWRILLFATSAVLMTGSTVALKKVYKIINGQGSKDRTPSRRKYIR